jgi:hypothetical protein
MTWNKNNEESQRRLLLEALTAALFSTAFGSGNAAAQVLGSRPAPLPKGKSIYRIEGQVLVDGQPATPDTRIAANSTIQTGKDGEVIYAVGETAHLQRSDSQVTMETKEANSVVVSGIRVLTGKILSVFPTGRPVRMTTRNASIGIRGTGTYMEADPEQTYFCTCYGTADIASASDSTSRETVVSRHHDRPLYILTGEQAGRNIRLAPFINHTDQELMLIEALVGRTPPFVFPKDDYTRPRRRTY